MSAGRAAETFRADQRHEINKMIHTYIMENPRVILEAVQQLQGQEEENKKELAKKNLATYRDRLSPADLATVLPSLSAFAQSNLAFV